MIAISGLDFYNIHREIDHIAMQSATKNSFWYLTFNISRMAVVFLGTMLISRVLGPADFGEFSYLLSIFLYVGTIDSLCHESIVKRNFSETERMAEVLGSASVLCLCLSMVSAVLIGLAGVVFVSPSIYLAAMLLFVPGVFSKPLNPISNFFDAQLLSKYSSFSLLVGATVSIAFRCGSLYFSKSLLLQAFGYSLQSIVCAIMLWLFFKKRFNLRQWSVSRARMKSIFVKSAPIFLSAVLFVSLTLSDIFMIKHILTSSEVGIYSVVIRLSEPWVIISSALCTSYFPLIFKYGHNPRKQQKLFVEANQLSVVFVFILGFFLTLSIDSIINTVLGASYAEVGGIFKIYFWGILFLFWANIQHVWEIYNELYSFSFFKTAFACMVKVVLNYYLGSRFGLKGFAYATLIAYFFYGFGFNAISPVMRSYLKIQLMSLNPRRAKPLVRFSIKKGQRWLSKKS